MRRRCLALVVLLGWFASALDFQVPAAHPKTKVDPKLAALAAKLKSPSDVELTKALNAISSLGKDGAPLAGPLCDLIADPRAAKVAALAGLTLSKVRPDLGPSVTKLRLIKEKDTNREAEAAQEIGALGKAGAPAVPVLIAVIKETAASDLARPRPILRARQLVVRVEADTAALDWTLPVQKYQT
jgi:hypothetical protein